MATDEIKELRDDIKKLTKTTTDGLHTVGTEVATLRTQVEKTQEGRFKDNERRIKSLENFRSFVITAVCSAVIAAVLKLVIL